MTPLSATQRLCMPLVIDIVREYTVNSPIPAQAICDAVNRSISHGRETDLTTRDLRAIRAYCNSLPYPETIPIGFNDRGYYYCNTAADFEPVLQSIKARILSLSACYRPMRTAQIEHMNNVKQEELF